MKNSRQSYRELLEIVRVLPPLQVYRGKYLVGLLTSAIALFLYVQQYSRVATAFVLILFRQLDGLFNRVVFPTSAAILVPGKFVCELARRLAKNRPSKWGLPF